MGVSDSVLAECFVYASNVIGTVLSLWTMDGFGRRGLLIGGSLAMAMVLLAVPVVLVTSPSSLLDASAGWTASTVLVVAALCLYIFTNAASVGPAGWVYVSEVFPYAHRARAVQTVLVAQTALSYLGAYTPYLVAWAGVSVSFLVFAAVILALAAVAAAFVVETAGVPIGQINARFKEQAARSACFGRKKGTSEVPR